MMLQRLILAVLGSFLLGHAALADEPAMHELQVPAGYKLLFSAKAKGVQIYASTADGDAFKWALEAPLAQLSAKRGKLIIHHYAGPSWEAPDGSKVARDKEAKPVSVPAPDAAADIPWLLIKVAADPAPGVLSQVAYVQRIGTKGGVAPAAAPIRADTKIGVPYTATYAFYVKAE
jgi:hypothetical protein